MIRYSVVVLLICVYYSRNVKAQMTIASGSGSCDGKENEYINFIRCMIECEEEENGITGLYEEDFCSNGIEIKKEGSGPDSFTVDDVKKALKCIDGKCKSAVPPSCGDSSPPIVADIPDDVENQIIDKLNSGQFVDVSKLKSRKSSHKSEEENSHNSEEENSHNSEEENSQNNHRHVRRRKVIHHRRVHKRVHRRQHLLRKLALAYGIPDGQLEDLVTQLDDASGSPPDTSGKDILDRLVDAAEKLPGQPDDSGSTMDKVEELLTKLVEDSGTPDQDEAAKVLLSRLLGISGLQEDQLNELLSILEKVSKKKTSQLNDSDLYGILLALLNDSGHPPGEVEIPYGSQPESFAFASGPQSGGIAVAYGPQPGTFESVVGPQFLVPDSSITPSSDATPGSTVSGATLASSPTDSALAADESLDDCDDVDENAPLGELDYSLDDDYSPDDYYEYDEDVPYYDYENVVYYDDYDCDNSTDYDYVTSPNNDFGNSTDYEYVTSPDNDFGNNTDYDYYDSTFYDYPSDYPSDFSSDYPSENGAYTNISYFDGDSIADPSIGGSASAFAGVQEINLNPYVQQNQPINVVSSSASVGGVPINQNPIIPLYQTNEQYVAGIFTGGGQGAGIFPNTPLQNTGFIQNPTAAVNVQTDPFGTAPVGGQLLNQNQGPLQNVFSQFQNPAIQQNQGINNGGGAIVQNVQNPGQFVNSFIQSQGFNSNPVQQQYQRNNYGSGFATNQQFPGQLAINPVQSPSPNIDPLAGFSVGSIFSPATGGNLGQTIPISANVPAQTQAFLGSNTGGNGPINIQQNSGIASQIPAAQTQNLAGSLPVQGQVFPGIKFGNGPSLNYPQINGGGINPAGSSASAAAGAVAGTRNLGQVIGGSLNVPVQSQTFTGGNFGNGQQLIIPQYTGNSAQQFNGGGIGQIPNGAVGSSYASGVSNRGASSSNNGFFNPGISNKGKTFIGNVPSNQGSISSFGHSASAGSSASAAAGSSASAAAGSSAGVQSFAM